MNKPFGILSLPVDKGGCGWYRVRQPFNMINFWTDYEAHVLDKDQDTLQMTKALSIAKVCVVRQGGEIGMRTFRKIPEFSHLKWVLDIDDNIELISPYSEHYGEYGLDEYFDPGIKKWVWKTGEHNFHPEKNRERVISLLQGMREADMVTTTTEKLASYARQYNPNVFVLPNVVNPDAWWPLNNAPNKQLRVGWSGGVSHYEDWYSIREPLNALMRKHRFKLIMAGSHFEGLIDPDNRDLIEVYPWVPFDAHSYRMMSLQLDISIIPLAKLPFNDYKSEIKLVEMSAMGIPSVTANVGPYADTKDKLRTLRYDTPEQFYSSMELLLTDPARRHEMGLEARKDAMRHYDGKKKASLWTDTYNQLLTESK